MVQGCCFLDAHVGVFLFLCGCSWGFLCLCFVLGQGPFALEVCSFPWGECFPYISLVLFSLQWRFLLRKKEEKRNKKKEKKGEVRDYMHVMQNFFLN